MTYDATKRRAYYLKVRQLKGKQEGSARPGASGFTKTHLSKPKAQHAFHDAALSTLARTTGKLRSIDNALKEAHAKLSELRKGDQKKRENKKKTDRENSDGKSTAKEKQSAKTYRDKNKTVLAAKRNSGGEKSATKSGGDPKHPNASKIKALESRIGELQVARSDAVALIKTARQRASQ